MKSPASTQKLRGGYYTPKPIADFLATWAIQSPATTILEPSFGDGNILEAAAGALLLRGADPASLSRLVYGVEIDEIEANKASERLIARGLPPLANVHIGDFFDYCLSHLLSPLRFDAVIGNPPFIRYQNFQEAHRATAFRLMEHAGLRPTRLTNAWVPFLVCSTLLLNPERGRIAMVIPAELLQVGYTAELRQFLAHYFSTLTLYTFKRLVFDDIQQEILLLLGERCGHGHASIRIVELEGLDDLILHDCSDLSSDGLKSMDHSTEKWTQYYLEQEEIDLLRALRNNRNLTPAGKVMHVDVGVVTGLNDYFVMTAHQAEERSLLSHTRPIVTRSAHLRGIVLRDADLAANAANQVPSLILTAPNVSVQELPHAVRDYVRAGEMSGSDAGYKCRIRDRWYIVPSIWRPDAFMLRQVHGYPKLVLNETAATSTDTIHRVRFVTELPAKAIVASFLNSLTFAFSEVEGRSYGGGVLELEPTEAEALLLPLTNAHSLDFDLIDRLVLQGDIEAVLDITDKALLMDGLGLSFREVRRLRSTWHRLRDRRINRNHGRRRKEALA